MIMTFGEILWDLFPHGKQLGGAVANCSVRLQNLGHKTYFISRLGNDALGIEALNILKEKGLNLELIQIDPSHTSGTVEVVLNDKGEADYTINEFVAYDYIEVTSTQHTLLKEASAIVFGSLIQRSEVSKKSLYHLLDMANDALKIVDINLRKDCYTMDTIRESLIIADVLKLNDEEVTTLSTMFSIESDSISDFCTTIAKQFNLKSVLVTLGDKGVQAWDRLEGFLELSAHKIEVVDTVGAGDNFTAGFVHGRLNNMNFEASCRLANAFGALAASKAGGMPEISMDEVRQLLGNFHTS